MVLDKGWSLITGVHFHVSIHRESGIQRGMFLVSMIHFHVNVKPTVTEKVEFQEGWSLGHQGSFPQEHEANSYRENGVPRGVVLGSLSFMSI